MMAAADRKIKEGFAQNEEYFQSIETKKIERKRIFTTKQKQRMIAVLAANKGLDVIIEFASTNQQSSVVAGDLAKIFNAAGWVAQHLVI